MKQRLFVLLLVFLSAGFFLMCDDESSKDGDDDIAIALTSALIESVPQIDTATKSVTSGNISEYATLSSLFKLECYMEGTFDFCPAGIDPVPGGDNNPYKLTSYTLIGSIAHAEMYSGGLKKSCEGTEISVSKSNFKAAQSGGDPAKYVLDYYELLSCIEKSGYEENVYHTYSVDPDASYQATLTSRYRVPYNGVSDPGQNDIFQVYTSISDGKATLLAYNYAGADTVLQRTVLLVNVNKHKFAVKHITPKSGGGIDGVTAIGVGGIDIESGKFNPGSYYTVFSTNSGTTEDGCVDNETGAFEADTAKCSAASIPMAWTGSDAVANYLELSADEKTRLAAFLAHFDSEVFLASSDTPVNTTTEVETNFPKQILP